MSFTVDTATVFLKQIVKTMASIGRWEKCFVLPIVLAVVKWHMENQRMAKSSKKVKMADEMVQLDKRQKQAERTKYCCLECGQEFRKKVRRCGNCGSDNIVKE